MDLEERGLRASANRLFNRYLAPEPPDALAGLVALPLFLSLRAAIRAKVEAAGAERLEGEKRDEARALARRYFDRAVRFLAYVPPRLIAVGGLSGVGKSALSRALVPEIGRSPGALWLRSDLERKAMFAVEETVRLPASAYASDVTRDVYRASHRQGPDCASGGADGPHRRDFRDRRRTQRRGRRGGGGRRRLRWTFSRCAPGDAPRAHRLPARRRFGRRRRSGAPADGGASRRDRMGGAGGFGGLERHDGPRSSAAPERVASRPGLRVTT